LRPRASESRDSLNSTLFPTEYDPACVQVCHDRSRLPVIGGAEFRDRLKSWAFPRRATVPGYGGKAHHDREKKQPVTPTGSGQTVADGGRVSL